MEVRLGPAGDRGAGAAAASAAVGAAPALPRTLYAWLSVAQGSARAKGSAPRPKETAHH